MDFEYNLRPGSNDCRFIMKNKEIEKEMHEKLFVSQRAFFSCALYIGKLVIVCNLHFLNVLFAIIILRSLWNWLWLWERKRGINIASSVAYLCIIVSNQFSILSHSRDCLSLFWYYFYIIPPLVRSYLYNRCCFKNVLDHRSSAMWMNRKYFNDQIHACRIEYAKGSSQNWIYGMYNICFLLF